MSEWLHSSVQGSRSPSSDRKSDGWKDRGVCPWSQSTIECKCLRTSSLGNTTREAMCLYMPKKNKNKIIIIKWLPVLQTGAIEFTFLCFGLSMETFRMENPWKHVRKQFWVYYYEISLEIFCVLSEFYIFIHANFNNSGLILWAKTFLWTFYNALLLTQFNYYQIFNYLSISMTHCQFLFHQVNIDRQLAFSLNTEPPGHTGVKSFDLIY